MIGALERPGHGDLEFESADGRTKLYFVRVEPRSEFHKVGVQIQLGGEWLNLSLDQAKAIKRWIKGL